jgi:hypothetical protein
MLPESHSSYPKSRAGSLRWGDLQPFRATVAERFYYREKNPQWSTESLSMAEQNGSSGNTLRLFIYWLIVGVPFVWGVWITILKLPALFR